MAKLVIFSRCCLRRSFGLYNLASPKVTSSRLGATVFGDLPALSAMKPSTAFGVRGRLATSDASKKSEKRDASANDTMEHWIWRSFAWQRLRKFNVNANNSIKDWLRQPLGPPFGPSFGQPIQLQRKEAVFWVSAIIFNLFGSYIGQWQWIFFVLMMVAYFASDTLRRILCVGYFVLVGYVAKSVQSAHYGSEQPDSETLDFTFFY